MAFLKALILIVSCAAITLGFEYTVLLNLEIENLNWEWDDLAESMSSRISSMRYQIEEVNNQFKNLASSVAEGDNPYAKEHVNNFRNNYTTIAFLFNTMLDATNNTMRKALSELKQEVFRFVPQLQNTSSDVNNILTYRNCNETIIEDYTFDLVSNITHRLRNSIMFYQYFYLGLHYSDELFVNYFHELHECVSGSFLESQSETSECMTHADDVYYGKSVGQFREALQNFENLVIFVLQKKINYVLRNINITLDRAYKDAMLTQCCYNRC